MPDFPPVARLARYIAFGCGVWAACPQVSTFRPVADRHILYSRVRQLRHACRSAFRLAQSLKRRKSPRVRQTPERYSALIETIEASFNRDALGRVIQLPGATPLRSA